MECFGTTDFDNNSQLTTLSVIIISGLHCISSITTADAHTSAASSRLNWRPCRFKWTHPFLRKTKSGSCACAITFQTQSTIFCADCPGLASVNRSLDGSLILCTLYCTIPGFLSKFGPTECNWQLNLQLQRKCSASSYICLSISLIQFLLAWYPVHDFKYFLYLCLEIRVKLLLLLQDIQKLLKQDRKGVH